MRSQVYPVVVAIKCLLQPNPERSLFMVRNLDGANSMYLQAGDSPGGQADFFPIRPGESFTLDPATPSSMKIVQCGWWVYGDAPLNCVVFEG